MSENKKLYTDEEVDFPKNFKLSEEAKISLADKKKRQLVLIKRTYLKSGITAFFYRNYKTDIYNFYGDNFKQVAYILEAIDYRRIYNNKMSGPKSV